MTFRIVCDGEEETGGDAINRFLAADDGPADACVGFDGWMKRRNSPEFVVATRGLVASTWKCARASAISTPAITEAPR